MIRIVTFDSLAVGARYFVGDPVPQEDTIRAVVRRYPPGSAASHGEANIGNGCHARGRGNEVELSSAGLDSNFGGRSRRIVLRYCQEADGGFVELDGVRVSFTDLLGIDGTTVADVAVAVTRAGSGRTGELVAEAKDEFGIRLFAIAGAELFIDEIEFHLPDD